MRDATTRPAAVIYISLLMMERDYGWYIYYNNKIIIVEESFHQNLQYNIIYYNNCVCNYIQLKDQGLINIFLHN